MQNFACPFNKRVTFIIIKFDAALTRLKVFDKYTFYIQCSFGLVMKSSNALNFVKSADNVKHTPKTEHIPADVLSNDSKGLLIRNR